MSNQSLELTPRRRWFLSQAAEDFFFLQNRRYPRSSALQWVGDRYGLTQVERQLLHRGVFGEREARKRRSRRCLGTDWGEEVLFVDGHNVQITVESAILGRMLLRANDEAVRDLAGQSARFRLSEASLAAMDLVFGCLGRYRPLHTVFLFDAPMSHSGIMASMYRERLNSGGLSGESRTVPVPEREIPYEDCVVASSDGAILDESSRWLDLAHAAIVAAGLLRLEADFSSLLLPRSNTPQ